MLTTKRTSRSFPAAGKGNLLITACLLVVLAGYSAIAQDSYDPPASGFVPGWEKSEDILVFVGHDLYAHINGGAELYHEFGFDRLYVQRFQKAGEELALEVYMMTSPEAALGLYLMKAGQETPVAGIPQRNTGGSSQITAVKGSAFVKVNNFTFADSLLPTMVALMNAALERIAEERPVRLLDRLPQQGMLPGSGRIIRGPYALAPVVTLGSGDILQMGGRIWGVHGRYIDQYDSTFTHIEIYYPDPERAGAAFNHLVQNLDEYLTVIEKQPRSFTFSDYQKRFGRVAVQDSVMLIDVNLYQNDSRVAGGSDGDDDSIDSAASSNP